MKPVVVIGGGGHAKVVIQTLRLTGTPVVGYTDLEDRHGGSIQGVPYLGTDEAFVLCYTPGDVVLTIGLGSVKSNVPRIRLYTRFKELGYPFHSLIHPSAVIADDVVIGEAVQIMAGAVIQPSVRIGANVIVNTRASVDHDCRLDDHCSIAPGAIITGAVTVATGAFVGAGATIIQNITIGQHACVGAGAVVLQDVRPGSTAVGIPAKEVGSS
ncbi:acetyltransferase [Paenibacillus antri]|uniref:Acetyltransferase n=1 Tax=Paenibacillus antri TaxID=2582848 RepID=A0A5R9G886_9BACL|nr:acetyltransferase [Paenibacillus antri]TLS50576.1 acetyltransferase [Paenibacillus antri]